MDVPQQKKRASEIAFASEAEPEVMQASQRASQPRRRSIWPSRPWPAAIPPEAGKLAQQSLQANEDPARAYFVLAKVASFGGDMQELRPTSRRLLDAAKDPHVVAWSHIYLGRILDMQGERDDAVAQYKAALAIGDVPPDAKTAAEHGLQQAYEPPTAKDKSGPIARIGPGRWRLVERN